MTARVLTIEGRPQVPGALVASLTDFTYTEGKEVDLAVVVENPDLSLYCLDDERKRAIFVQLPPGVDLTKSPFVYRTQNEQAERLIAVPYDLFLHLATGLPRVERLIPIYISGRSGSTLLSHAFNESGTVMSLSEPDVATQLALLRDPDGSRDEELVRLLDGAVRFLFKPNPYKQASIFSLKFRAEATRGMDLYEAAFPGAKNLYSYRDAVGWVRSFYRIFKSWGYEDQQSLSVWLPVFRQTYKKSVDELRAYLGEGEDVPLTKICTLWWLFAVELYLAQYERGTRALAVRYEDLKRHREAVLQEVFVYCGLPVSGVAKALRAFEKDAQAGTPLAREDSDRENSFRLSKQQLADLHDVLQRHPVVTTPDFVLPGTLSV